MTKHSTTRHVNVLHDPVGDAMGWLLVLAGPVRDRAALIAAFPRPAVRRVAGQLSIPMFATLPEAATRFRTVLHGAPEDGVHQRRKAGRLVTTK
jgi:hypothetical protein